MRFQIPARSCGITWSTHKIIYIAYIHPSVPTQCVTTVIYAADTPIRFARVMLSKTAPKYGSYFLIVQTNCSKLLFSCTQTAVPETFVSVSGPVHWTMWTSCPVSHTIRPLSGRRLSRNISSIFQMAVWSLLLACDHCFLLHPASYIRSLQATPSSDQYIISREYLFYRNKTHSYIPSAANFTRF